MENPRLTESKGFNVAALATSARCAHYGVGKHLMDPTLSPEAKVDTMRQLFYAQVTNLLSMMFAKTSSFRVVLLNRRGCYLALDGPRWLSQKPDQ